MSGPIPAPLRIAGYAALFGLRDSGGDTIRKGAFARTLREREVSGAPPLPLYWQHRAAQQIGWVEEVAEDARGLRVIARIDAAASRAAPVPTRPKSAAVWLAGLHAAGRLQATTIAFCHRCRVAQ